MRTTIRLPDNLLEEAKIYAARSGKTLTTVIEDALRESLARKQGGGAPKQPIRLTTIGGAGLQPGVDLDDSAALLELMEAPDDPA
jgi:hypothetical protein